MSERIKLKASDPKFTEEYVNNKVKQMQAAAEQDDIEYDKWWKTLTPQQQKEHDDDVSRLCDVEI
ncbi:MAG: hypothetical protein IPL26_09855 [Leptospiraceae bacterium]|jgi:regulator of RNase E activity RraB|nr:hypothetical protein [Leptospiraceae bacterium]